MDTLNAAFMARSLMVEHGLSGWTFKWDGAKRRAGQCNYTKRTISLSRPLTALHDESKVRDTVLHEIAHALVGAGNGHNGVWRRKAIEIGSDGKRCFASDPSEQPAPNWIAKCPQGHLAGARYRRPKNGQPMSCARCSPVFDRANLVTWIPATGIASMEDYKRVRAMT